MLGGSVRNCLVRIAQVPIPVWVAFGVACLLLGVVFYNATATSESGDTALFGNNVGQSPPSQVARAAVNDVLYSLPEGGILTPSLEPTPIPESGILTPSLDPVALPESGILTPSLDPVALPESGILTPPLDPVAIPESGILTPPLDPVALPESGILTPSLDPVALPESGILTPPLDPVAIPDGGVLTPALNPDDSASEPSNALLEAPPVAIDLDPVFSNGSQVITISFSSGNLFVNETDDSLVTTLLLSTPSPILLSVGVITVDGTAVSGIDYEPGPYFATFAANSDTATVAIPVIDKLEPHYFDETVQINDLDFLLQLDSPERIGDFRLQTEGITEAAVTIVDNDTNVDAFLYFLDLAFAIAESDGVLNLDATERISKWDKETVNISLLGDAVSPLHSQIVSDAVDMFNDILYDTVGGKNFLTLSHGAAQHDISVEFLSESEDPRLAGGVIGYARGSSNASTGSLARVMVVIEAGRTESSTRLTFVHELAHALGFWGHTLFEIMEEFNSDSFSPSGDMEAELSILARTALRWLYDERVASGQTPQEVISALGFDHHPIVDSTCSAPYFVGCDFAPELPLGELPNIVNLLDESRVPYVLDFLSLGAEHGCGIRPSGFSVCWGSNDFGKTSPTNDTFSAISAGGDHTCGIRVDDNKVECWGDDSEGQSSPPAVEFRAINAGKAHTCGIKMDNTVECWGDDSNGQSSPTNDAFSTISAGEFHTCGIRLDDNTVECWGDNSNSQSSPPAEEFQTVSAGGNHTCGIRSDDTVECWGDDSNGQSSPPGEEFQTVSAGGNHTCGIRLDDDTVECWGDDSADQSSPPGGEFIAIAAGGDRTCGSSVNGTLVCWPAEYQNRTIVPVATYVDVGLLHTCARLHDGTVDCWGDNDAGQSMPPENTQSNAPEIFLRGISAGGFHTCGVKDDGTVQCWGLGSDSNRNEGRRDYGQAVPPTTGDFLHVTAGVYHTCGLQSDGVVTCWGLGSDPNADEDGSDGFDYDQASPPPDLFIQISAGTFHTCGVKTDGFIECWGLGVDPNVDEGSQDGDQAFPPSAVKFKSVSGGGFHTCGITAEDTVMCWGAGTTSAGSLLGSLLMPNEQGQADPPGGRFVEISLGLLHTCGIRPDGTVECWGYDAFNQSSPPEDETFTDISADRHTTCGVNERAVVTCWGSNAFLQLLISEESDDRFVVTNPSENRIVRTGPDHACARDNNGITHCWGNDLSGSTFPPVILLYDLAVSSNSSCGLSFFGNVLCWGLFEIVVPGITSLEGGYNRFCGTYTDGYLRCWPRDYPPVPGAFTQIDAHWSYFCTSEPCHTQAFSFGSYNNAHRTFTETFVCGLRPDGSIYCWGENQQGQSDPPTGDFSQISVGAQHACAIRTDDGTVECWGSNSDDRSTPPEGSFTLISLGFAHGCGIRTNGTVTCWGNNLYDQADPPLGNFTDISASETYTCGVTELDDVVVCWGSNNAVSNAVPQLLSPGNPAISFAQSEYVVTEDETSVVITVERSPRYSASTAVNFQVYLDQMTTAVRGPQGDFSFANSPTTFQLAEGDNLLTFAVRIHEDLIPEDTEEIVLYLLSASNVRIVDNLVTTIVIQDDDGRIPVGAVGDQFFIDFTAPDKTIILPDAYSDPNGETLNFSALSSDRNVVAVTLSDAVLTLSAVARGDAQVAITVSNSLTNVVSTFAVVVGNALPTGSIPPVSFESISSANKTFDLSAIYSDADNDPLTFAVFSSDAGVISATLSGSVLTLSAVGRGSGEVTVTVSDGITSISDTITVTIGNRVPVGSIASVSFADVSSLSRTFDLSAIYSDADNDPLTFAVSSSDTSVISATLSGSVLTLSAVGRGSGEVTVTVSDGITSISDTITVTVGNSVPTGSIGTVSFDDVLSVSKTFDLSAIYSDADNDPLTFAVSSSDAGVISATLSGSVLTLSAVGRGSGEVTVTVSDGITSISDTITVTVGNSVPVGSIAPVSFADISSVGRTFDLSAIYSDADNDPLTFAVSSSDAGVISATLSGSVLTLSASGRGNAQVTITVSDGIASSISDTITVTVGNSVPVGSIASVSFADVSSLSRTFDLSTIYSDADNDPLTFAVSSSDASVISATLSGSVLTLSTSGRGSGEVTVTVSDGITSISDTITVTVGNSVPTGSIGAVSFADVLSASRTFDLSAIYSDADGDPLTFAVSSSDTSVISVTLSGSVLTLSAVGRGSGEVTVTVRDGITSISDTITVTVGNSVPVGSIAPVSFANVSSVSRTFDLSATYSDADGDPLTFAVSSSDASVISATLSGSVLTLSAVGRGSGEITVTVSDGITSISDTITVTVGNSVPVGSIAPVSFANVSSVSRTFDLSTIYSDADNDPLTFAVSSSDAGVISATLSGGVLTLSAVDRGSGEITVTVRDGITSILDTITVTVGNSVPVGSIAPVSFANVSSVSRTFNLSTIYSDADNDPLTFAVSSSDASVISATLSGSVLTLSAVGRGNAQVTITVSDGITSISDTITVTVGNSVPVGSIVPVSFADISSVSRTFDLSAIYSDADNDPLTFAVSSSAANVVSATLSGSMLTLSVFGRGSGEVTVSVSDGITSISDTITVTVGNSVPVGSIVPVSFADISSVSRTFDLSAIYSDADNDPLTFAVSSSDTSVISATLSGSVLTLSASGRGSGEVTVTVGDGITSISDTITVTVGNSVPVGSIAPVSFANVSSVSRTFDLSAIYSDADNDPLTFAVSSSDTSVISATLSGSVLTLSVFGRGSGEVTVTVSDGMASISDTITVTVGNSVPTGSIGAVSFADISSVSRTFDLSTVYSDADNDPLTFAVSSSAESVVSATLSGSVLTLSAVGRGNAQVTITVNDGVIGITDTIVVVVNSPTVVIPPVVNPPPFPPSSRPNNNSGSRSGSGSSGGNNSEEEEEEIIPIPPPPPEPIVLILNDILVVIPAGPSESLNEVQSSIEPAAPPVGALGLPLRVRILDVVDITLRDSNGNVVSTLDEDAEVCFGVTDELSTLVNEEYSLVGVYRLNELIGENGEEVKEWEVLESVYRENSNEICAATEHFSLYALGYLDETLLLPPTGGFAPSVWQIAVFGFFGILTLLLGIFATRSFVNSNELEIVIEDKNADSLPVQRWSRVA